MRAVNVIMTGLIFLLLAFSCGRGHHDDRLERIWEYVAENPEEAMAALDSIDTRELSESDLMFYNLMSIKAKDKVYLLHKSDSLILKVIDYYSRHKNDELFSEALYYGGRVYYDLGDYPTALKYFQKALDLLPENTPQIRLRGNVLSQTSGVLEDVGLYDQSLSYVKESLEIDCKLNDIINVALDYNSLGAIYLHSNKLDSAYKYFRLAELCAEHFSDSLVSVTRMYQAAVFYYKNDVKNAINLIRPLVNQTNILAKNTLLAYASKIYLKAESLDTAYLYARELALSNFPDNRKTGYSIMLSPELRHMVAIDSLDYFYNDYKRVLEAAFKHQEENQALIQNSMYNYRVHERQKHEAERSRDKIYKWLIALIAIAAILIAFILYLLNKSKSKVIAMHEALAKLSILEESLANKRIDDHDESEGNDMASCDDVFSVLSEVPQKIKNEKTLKNELREKLRELNANSTYPYEPLPLITESQPYLEMRTLLKENKPIPDKSEIWAGLEDIVLECFPNFKSTLLILSDNDLNNDDLQIALLLKCGFTLKELGILLGRTKGAVTYRRKKLSVRLFGENLDLESVDNIIRTL